MRFYKHKSLLLASLLVILLFSCSKNTPEEIKDNIKELISFNLKRADGTAFAVGEITITIQSDTVKAILPLGTDATNLIPEIEYKGVSIGPSSGISQNFTVPVRYTITAADGSTKQFVVVVRVIIPSGTVYIGSSDNHLYALDASTGKLKWSYEGENSFVYSSPTYNNGVLYIGGIDNYVYAMDAATGALKWRTKAGDTGIESDAVFADGTVYVGSNDDNLYAIDAATGTIKWKYLTGGNVSSSPVIANGLVYFGSSDNNLYALQQSTGALVWKFETGAMINQSGASLSDGVLYVGSRDGYLYAVNASTGTLKWKYSTGDISLEQSSPTVADGVVYIGGWYNIGGFTNKGSLYAINAATGKEVWKTLPNAYSTSPCVANGRLFICGDDGNITAIKTSDGRALWSQLIYANGASPTEAEGVVYVGGGGTWHIYAFNAATGAEIWRFHTPKGLSNSSPLVVNDAGTASFSGDSGARQ